MTWQTLEEALDSVLSGLRIDEADTGAATNAPRSVAPGGPGTEFVATSHVRERTQPVAFAQDRPGGQPAAQTELGKMGEPKPPRVQEEVSQTEARSRSGFMANRRHMPPALRVVSSKSIGRARPTRHAPAVARPIHLLLVVDNGHCPPHALGRHSPKPMNQTATRNRPAVKP